MSSGALSKVQEVHLPCPNALALAIVEPNGKQAFDACSKRRSQELPLKLAGTRAARNEWRFSDFSLQREKILQEQPWLTVYISHLGSGVLWWIKGKQDRNKGVI